MSTNMFKSGALPDECLRLQCGHSVNVHRVLIGLEPFSNLKKADPYEPSFGTPIGPWYRYFAWKPVHTADRGTVWGRKVWRRRVMKKTFLFGGPDFWFQHCVDRQGS